MHPDSFQTDQHQLQRAAASFSSFPRVFLRGIIGTISSDLFRHVPVRRSAHRRPRRQPLPKAPIAVFLAACLTACITSSQAHAAAATYPQHAIDLIVPVAPAGSLDILSRLLAAELEPRLKASIAVKNKPGANGNLAFESVAQAAPDGYTLLIAPDSIAINPSLYTKVNYDPLRSYEPIAQATIAPLVLVAHPGLGARSLAEFVAIARQKNGRLNVASPGNGSAGHLAGELFQRDTGVTWTHVPYKGGGPAVTDLLGHHVDALFVTLASAVPYIKSGDLTALAVTTARRSSAFPQVPTVAEATASVQPGLPPGSPGLASYEVTNWQGIFAPAGTPAPIVQKLNAEIDAILREPRVRDKLATLGFEPVGGAPAELARRVRENVPKWAAVIKQAGVEPD